jgi:hypothetical protein
MPSAAREPLLGLNNPELEWKRFERFCLDLVKALPDVRDAHLYGVRGDDQEGIDIHADLIDGRVRSIQCRRVAKFGKPQTVNTIADTDYPADEHQIWVTCGLSAPARKLLDTTNGWDAWDIEQISSQTRALPREVARWLVEDHLGSVERRRFLGPDSDLNIALARAWFARTDGQTDRLRTDQPLQGRSTELRALDDALHAASVKCILLVGRGGIGKSRLLRAVADRHPDRRMLLVREAPDTAMLSEELPLEPFDLIIDDAHRREDLPQILATALQRNDLDTLILATRPHRLPSLHAQLVECGLTAGAVRELDPLAQLPSAGAESLAQHELDAAHRHLARRLGDLTRDIPAILVLAARMLSTGDLDPSALVADDALRRDIMSRFRDERLGRLDESVSPDLAAALLALLTAVQPIDSTSPTMITWLASTLSSEPSRVTAGLGALGRADLLAGSERRQRVAPDVLADYLLHEQCIGADGRPTGRADELLSVTPDQLLGRLMANLAELDWQLDRAGETRILEGVCSTLTETLVKANAWRREQTLEAILPSAAYLAPWVIELSRQLIDHPAADTPLFADAVITDADSRRGLVQLLARAALDPTCTNAAIRLLWELGADVAPQSARAGGDPIQEIQRLTGYHQHPHYAESVLTVAIDLLSQPDAEAHLHLPVALLASLTRRGGTISEMTAAYRMSLGSYVVNAQATLDLRTRLRTMLVEQTLQAGQRIRVAAAALLGGMLSQPHGYYGRSISPNALKQWRPEQLAVLADIDTVMSSSQDPIVSWVLRDAIAWHGQYSALHGVKTKVRNIQSAHAAAVDEQIIDAVTHSLARLPMRKALDRRRRKLTRELRAQAQSTAQLLDRLDDLLLRLSQTRPETSPDIGPLLAALAADDPNWALDACRILISEPQRPSAAAVGVLMTAVLHERPADTHALLNDLARSPDALLRRLAADHITRMAWLDNHDAPERALVVKLAADEDPIVVACAVLTALRCCDSDASLAAEIITAVKDLTEPRIAEHVCMVLSHDLSLDENQWQTLLNLFLSCPEVEYWYDEMLVKRASVAWRQVLDHVLARIDTRTEDYNYRAVPFEGFSGDLLDGHDQHRRAVLDELLGALAKDISGNRSFDLPLLFWSLAGDSEQAFGAIAAALAGHPPTRSAAMLVLGEAGPGRLLACPEWIDAQLTASGAGEALDELQEALSSALGSGIKQGTPGQPFPQDVALASAARAHAQAAAAGGRTAAFWERIAKITDADIREQVRRDEDLAER